MSENCLGAAAAVVAAQISVNLGATLGKSLFAAVGPGGAALLRTTIAALVLLALVRPWREAIGRADLGKLAAYGVVLGGMNLLIYEAIARIPIGVAVAIELAGPLAVVVLASRTRGDLAWLALALTGLALLIPWPGRDAVLDPLGVGFALGAAVCWAGYIVLGARASHVSGPAAVAIGISFACLVTVPVGVATAGSALLSSHALALGAVVALLSSAVPFVLEMIGLRRLPPKVFGMIVSSSPAIAALCGFALLGERLSAGEWLAVALMIAASAGSAITARPAPPAPVQPTISSGLKK